MKKHVFKNRNEVVEFLEGYNFKYYIPRLSEYGSVNKREYYIEITENNKINYCSIRRIENDYITHEHPFYDCNHANNFKMADIGEEIYLNETLPYLQSLEY